jgi:hypothetical protein
MDTARSPRRIATVISVAVALVAGLAGCSSAVQMSPAPSANAAACAAVQVRLPQTVQSTLTMRSTNAQSTAAWGSPAAVIYHCGVPVPQVSDLPCFTLGPIDWIRDVQGKNTIYTTFGRSPAVQVVMSDKATSEVLQDLQSAVETLPKNGRKCLSPSQVN